jgi:hypothetical protein
MTTRDVAVLLRDLDVTTASEVRVDLPSAGASSSYRAALESAEGQRMRPVFVAKSSTRDLAVSPQERLALLSAGARAGEGAGA